MKRGPEAKVKDKIKTYLASIGAYHFWPVQTGLGASTVDCLACVPITITPDMVGRKIGAFVAIEVKRPDTRPEPTPRQEAVLRQVAAAYGGISVAYEVEDVKSVL